MEELFRIAAGICHDGNGSGGGDGGDGDDGVDGIYFVQFYNCSWILRR